MNFIQLEDGTIMNLESIATVSKNHTEKRNGSEVVSFCHITYISGRIERLESTQMPQEVLVKHCLEASEKPKPVYEVSNPNSTYRPEAPIRS